MQAVRGIPACNGAEMATQWPQLLDDAGTDHSVAAQQRRDLAALIEKGDSRALHAMSGRRIVAWAPTDASALMRLLADLLRQRDPALRPRCLSCLAPLPNYPGVDTPAEVFDLWWHPLRAKPLRWSPL